jgi:hypothetical protein
VTPPFLDPARVPAAAEVDALWRDGQVTLRAVCTAAEAAAWRPVLAAAAAAVPPLVPTAAEGAAYARAFRQHTNLWQAHAAAAGFSLAPRFGRIAAGLLRARAVRIYHDQWLCKRAGDGPTPWHQDKHYWPIDGELLTMWMPLVDVAEGMGCLRFAPGSHRLGALSGQPISADADNELAAIMARRGLRAVGTGPLRAGDASFHLAWTLHGAEANGSAVDREAMTVIFVADGARVVEPRSEGQRNDLGTWLPGLRAGDPVASPLNPCVWRS